MSICSGQRSTRSNAKPHRAWMAWCGRTTRRTLSPGLRICADGSNHLLVGNFSFPNSGINAFDPTTGKFRGTIPINVGKGHTPGGLWSLEFGVGGSNGDPNTLYFFDGI